MARGAQAVSQPSSGAQHPLLVKLGQQVDALTRGFSRAEGNAEAARQQLQLARQVCEALGVLAAAAADSAHVWSKLVALAERLRSFCQPLSTDPSTFGRLVKISSEILVLIDAACYAAAAYSAVLHARALQHQLSAEEVASARAACTALDAGAAALRHMSHSASAGGLLGRGISAQNHMAQELSVRLLMQLQAAAILRQLAYPAVEPEDGVAPDAPPATFQQGRWVLSYSMTCGVLYAWTPTSPQRPEFAQLSILSPYCNLLLGLLDEPCLRRQRDELLGHPASAQAVVTTVVDVCLPALARAQTAGLEAHSNGQLGTAIQRQQELGNATTALLLQLCGLLPVLLAAPRLQPALASQSAELQQCLHANVHKLAAAVLHALPAKPSDAATEQYRRLAWHGAAELPCLLLQRLRQQGGAAGSAAGSSGSPDWSGKLHLPSHLSSAAVEAAGHLPAACDALAVMAHSRQAPDKAALQEAVSRCSTAVRLLIHVSAAAQSLQGGLFSSCWTSRAQPAVACAGAAAAGLRYLPFLDELRRMWPQLSHQAPKQEQTPERLAHSLLELWLAWAGAVVCWDLDRTPCGRHNQQATGQPSAAAAAAVAAAAAAAAEGEVAGQLDAAAAAAEHLHAIGCRVVHYLATPSGQELFAAMDQPTAASNHWLQVVVAALNGTLAVAARGLTRQVIDAADSDGMECTAAQAASRLRSLCAAHWQALLAAFSIERSRQDAAQQAGRSVPPLHLHSCSEMDLALSFIAENCQQYMVDLAEWPATAQLVENRTQNVGAETAARPGLTWLAGMSCVSPQMAAVMSRRGVFARLLSSEGRAPVASLTFIPRAAGLLKHVAAAALQQLRSCAEAGSSKQPDGTSSSRQAAGSTKEQQVAAQRLDGALALLAKVPDHNEIGGSLTAGELHSLLRAAEALSDAMLHFWALPEQAAAARLEAARAAGGRRCANLCCASLQGGLPRKKCGKCGTRYCCAACCIADWRQGGHKEVCAALAAKWLQAEE